MRPMALLTAMALTLGCRAGKETVVVSSNPTTPDAQASVNSETPTDVNLVTRLRRLPDLLAQARATVDASHPERDVYVIQEELAAQLAAARRAYTRSTPYRSPPEPCSTGAHDVPRLKIDVTNASGATMTFWEAHLHEIEHHGASLTPDERRFLVTLSP